MCLKDYVTSHNNDCRLHPERCVLAEHVIMDYDNASVLEKEFNNSKRQFIEMGHILYQNKNCINKRTDIKYLSKIFSYLLFIDKHSAFDGDKSGISNI